MARDHWPDGAWISAVAGAKVGAQQVDERQAVCGCCSPPFGPGTG
jgi:hypothetical protein